MSKKYLSLTVEKLLDSVDDYIINLATKTSDKLGEIIAKHNNNDQDYPINEIYIFYASFSNHLELIDIIRERDPTGKELNDRLDVLSYCCWLQLRTVISQLELYNVKLPSGVRDSLDWICRLFGAIAAEYFTPKPPSNEPQLTLVK